MVLEDALAEPDGRLAVVSLDDLSEVEILNREVIGVEFEIAAHRFEIGGFQRGEERGLGLDDAQKKRRAEIYVEATNAALKGIPAEKVRFHTCYGINEGPRLYEAALSDVIAYMLKINAGSYSFEGANPRHEHEYHLFEQVKIPDGKVLCPGMITHASNIVEHPELIAERIMRYAKLVGRQNVMAGADCGFSSQALYKTEVHHTVVWEKFKALRQGADIATKRLWSN